MFVLKKKNYHGVKVTGSRGNDKIDISLFKTLTTMQNYNPLRKQTLGKMLVGQTICPV